MKPDALTLFVAILVIVLIVCLPWFTSTPRGACQTLDVHECGGNVIALHEILGDNPCMAVSAKVGTFETAMCIDTGFAGACLLSLPCLATAPRVSDPDHIVHWCQKTQSAIASASASASAQEAALQRFTATNMVSTFTAGCTMRLSSIGATKESTSEMLLTPPLLLRTVNGAWTSPRACSGQPVAEVLTSTPMKTIHLLTCDWLVQNAPVLLSPHTGVMRTNLSAAQFVTERRTMHASAKELSGGAFVATIRVGGIAMRVTVDSGAACYLSLGKQAATKLTTCHSTGRTMRQIGANGERVCAHAVMTTVEMGGAKEHVPVLVNDTGLDSEDGYIGYCFLRHFDLCITPDTFYARRNDTAFDPTLLDNTLSDSQCPHPGPVCDAS